MDRIARWLTRSAAIVRPVVAIIAALKPGFTWHKVCAHHAITALRQRAVAQTGVSIVTVAIVTELTLLNDAIAATGRPAFVAGIERVIITVIATFTRPDHTITAARLRTVAPATVGVDQVTIIAGFISWLTARHISPPNAIPADCGEAVVQTGISHIGVGIIALFHAVVSEVISTARYHTVSNTPIVVEVITIIAIFEALFAFFEVIP